MKMKKKKRKTLENQSIKKKKKQFKKEIDDNHETIIKNIIEYNLEDNNQLNLQ